MKTIKAYLMLAVIALVVAACSGNGANNGRSGANAPDNASEAGSGKQEPVTIKYTFWGSPNEKKVQEAAIKGFMKKYPWITVKAQHIPEEYTTKLQTMAVSGETPDIGLLYGEDTMKWAEEGRLYNIKDFFDNDSEIQLTDVLENTQYWWDEGKLAGINGALEVFGLFYNKAMFEELGVEPLPTKAEEALSWEEFVEVAQRLTIDSGGRNALDPAFDPGKIKQFGISLPTWAYMNAVESNGGKFVNEDGTQFMLSEPEAVEAIQRWQDLIYKYHVAPTPTQSASFPGGATGLQSKKFAISMDGQWTLVDLGASGLDFGIGVLPVMKQMKTMNLGEPIVIFKDTKHPQEAWLLLKWMMNPENTLELQSSGLWMPVLKKWYEDPELIAKWAQGNSAHPEGYVDAILNNGFNNGFQNTVYYVRNVPEINSVLQPAFDLIWQGKQTAEQALGDVKPKVEAVLKGVYNR
ncbi:ABC transporter substrate-binding protein [Paenibacillus arenilitoris]|uniref:Sugar ABC transporter substrate-binding protein n=1 Tax=Paenibacillus arenilitoris TaxID=2772299 RepID=A0A927CQG7_9BACL|nr:sugar ABC transporter substrate-binding protein [Paenibacillus arenilitoris]MBD2871677.1 sugar ABC transporter substrate-binding protein [Paenibacillus arenilitoris]